MRLALVAALAITPGAMASSDPPVLSWRVYSEFACGQMLWPADGWYKDRFGSSIASDGEWLLVGAGNDDTACPFDPFCQSGSAYFYRRDADGAYAFWQKVVPDDIARQDAFGYGVALEGTTALIGRAGGDAVSPQGGEVLVYELQGDQWVSTERLHSGHALTSGGFGGELELDGDLLAVKAGYFDAGGRPHSVAVEVFRRLGGQWVYEATITDPEQRGYELWIDGFTVSNGTIIIHREGDEAFGDQTGGAWVFEGVDGQWRMVQKVVPNLPTLPTWVRDADIDGDRLVLGVASDSAIVRANGVVEVFERDPDGVWRDTAELRLQDPVENAALGVDVRLDGNRVMATMQRWDPPGETHPLTNGGIAVFDLHGDLWHRTLVAQPWPAGGWGGSHLDFDLQGDTVYIGHRQITPTPLLDSVGAVFVYDIACLACSPDLDADGALTVFDFLLFFNLFDDGSSEADFDGDGELTIFDFLAFQTAFDAGC